MKSIQNTYNTIEDFKHYVLKIQPYLNLEMFKSYFELMYNNDVIPDSDNLFNKQIKKDLKLQGKSLYQQIFWVSRGWDNPLEKVSDIQKSWSKKSLKENAHKGKCSLQWFIDKYGEEEGSIKHSEHYKKLTVKNTYEHILKEKGVAFLEEKKKQRSTILKLEGFIKRHGEEVGTQKYKEFCNKSAVTIEKFIDKFGKELGEQKFSDRANLLALQATQRFIIDGNFTPNKGLNETKILDQIEKDRNIKIDRNFKIWRYHPDGYCHETNTVYEVYEKYHKLHKQIVKDEYRIRWIKNKLQCEVVIIWDV